MKLDRQNLGKIGSSRAKLGVAVAEVVAIIAGEKTAIFAAGKAVSVFVSLRDHDATGLAARTELIFPHLLAIR
jgi:hypothetical protein